MAKASDRIRDWWEGLQPRERNMMAALGVTAVVCVLGFVGFAINDGLERIETRNEEMREALKQLHMHRLEQAKGTATKAKQVQIPDEDKAVDLENYLGTITKDVGVSFPKFNRGEQMHGEFVETTGRIELKDVNIAQLKDFLQRVEANPVVVIRELRIKQDFRDKEKLDVPELVVATFYKKGAAPVEEAEAKE